MSDLATLQTRLTEAETALHQLSTGTKAVSINTGTETVSYNQISMGKLRAYIADLEGKIISLGGTVVGKTRARRAIAVSF